MIIIKLGGSIITDKSEYRKFNEKIVENIVKILKVMNKQMIIIHGGGSFGHIKSKEFGLPGPVSERTIEGMNIVHNDMVELNLKISRVFQDNNIYNISLPVTSAFIISCWKSPEIVLRSLASGFVFGFLSNIPSTSEKNTT